MPYQVKPPDSEVYTLDETDTKFGIQGERTFVAIREATHAEDKQRSSLFAEITRIMDPTGANQLKISQSLNSDELVEMDIYLTLSDSNLTDYDGGALFHFKQVGSVKKLDMNLADFKAALGKLSGFIVDEIHAKVALKNPDWFGPLGKAS